MLGLRKRPDRNDINPPTISWWPELFGAFCVIVGLIGIERLAIGNFYALIGVLAFGVVLVILAYLLAMSAAYGRYLKQLKALGELEKNYGVKIVSSGRSAPEIAIGDIWTEASHESGWRYYCDFCHGPYWSIYQKVQVEPYKGAMESVVVTRSENVGEGYCAVCGKMRRSDKGVFDTVKALKKKARAS